MVLLEMKCKKIPVNDDDPPKAGTTAYDKCLPLAKTRYLGTAFIQNLDPHQFSSLITDLSNHYTQGNNQYPDNLTQAYNMLVQFKADSNKQRQKTNKPKKEKKFTQDECDDSKSSEEDESESREDVSFVNNTEKLETKPDIKTEIKCYLCNNPGFTVKTCPKCDQ